MTALSQQNRLSTFLREAFPIPTEGPQNAYPELSPTLADMIFKEAMTGRVSIRSLLDGVYEAIRKAKKYAGFHIADYDDTVFLGPLTQRVLESNNPGAELEEVWPNFNVHTDAKKEMICGGELVSAWLRRDIEQIYHHGSTPSSEFHTVNGVRVVPKKKNLERVAQLAGILGAELEILEPPFSTEFSSKLNYLKFFSGQIAKISLGKGEWLIGIGDRPYFLVDIFINGKQSSGNYDMNLQELFHSIQRVLDGRLFTQSTPPSPSQSADSSPPHTPTATDAQSG